MNIACWVTVKDGSGNGAGTARGVAAGICAAGIRRRGGCERCSTALERTVSGSGETTVGGGDVVPFGRDIGVAGLTESTIGACIVVN